MINPMNLTGHRILITGASSGIGRACAVLCAELGASVILVARSEKGLCETLDMMPSPEKHRIFPFDLMNTDKIGDVFSFACSDGKLSGLVHAAGTATACPVGSLSGDVVLDETTLNFFAFLAMGKFFSKNRYFESGSVVAVSSVSANAGWAGGALYCGTKGALSASVRALALELAAKKIRVNSVLPSNIRTPMFDTLVGDVNDESSLGELLKKQPLGIGEPADVAHAVCFLLSDAARFITGTDLVVDGGYLAQ